MQRDEVIPILDFGSQYAQLIARRVREKGVYRAERALAAGDALKVSVRSGMVSYSVNGAAFYTSATPPSYPLLVDTSFYDLGATLTAVTLARP